jgi:diguanylate cyclase (GGDEF)-like protein
MTGLFICLTAAAFTLRLTAGRLSGWPWLALGLSGAGTMGAGVWLNRPRHRAAWLLLVASAAAVALSDFAVIHRGSLSGGQQALLDLPEFLPAVAGLTLLVRDREAGTVSGGVTDIVTFAVGLAALLVPVLYFDLPGVFGDPSSTDALSSIHPLADLALVAIAVRLASGSRTPAALLLAAGAGLLFVSGLVIALYTGEGANKVIFSARALFLLCWSLAALSPSMRDLGVPDLSGRTPARRVPVALPACIVMTVPALLLARGLQQGSGGEALLAVITGASGMLMTARLHEIIAGRRQAEARQAVLVAGGSRLVAAEDTRDVADVAVRTAQELLPPRSGAKAMFAADLAGAQSPARLASAASLGTGLARRVPAGSQVIICPMARDPGAAAGHTALVVSGRERDLAAAFASVRILGAQSSLAMARIASDRAARGQAVRDYAGRDPLTGLASDAMIRERTAHALATRKPDRLVALLAADIDDFTSVNTMIGLTGGDVVLSDVARRLTRRFGFAGGIARTNADRFAILVSDAVSEAELPELARRMLATFAEPFQAGGTEIRLGCSVGFATSAEADSADTLVRNVGLALSAAQAKGPGSWTGYDPGHQATAAERARLRADLERAIDREQLRVLYQPVVALADGRVAGFEALIRWQHPELGQLSPDRFIELAEQTGQINALGAWVLRQAAQDAVLLNTASASPVFMEVNASPRQLGRGEFIAAVKAALAATGLAPGQLVIELTESALIHDGDAGADLRAMKDLGVGLAMDDFGTGYSSLSYLYQLPFDVVKVDRSLIAGLGGDRPRRVMRGIVQLAGALDMTVIAEGVETAEQRDLLATAGCQYGQGYLFSRPVPIDQATALVT